MHEKFRDQNFSETRKSPPSMEKRGTPAPLIHESFSIPEFFWNTEVFSNEIFWYR